MPDDNERRVGAGSRSDHIDSAGPVPARSDIPT
jgi:hypothetical protein